MLCSNFCDVFANEYFIFIVKAHSSLKNTQVYFILHILDWIFLIGIVIIRACRKANA